MNKQDIKKVIVAQQESRIELRYIERDQHLLQQEKVTDPFVRIFFGGSSLW